MILKSVGGVDMQGFQTKALVVTSISGENFSTFSHPNVWLAMHVCPDKAELSFSQKKTTFLMLLQTYTKLTFGLSNVLVITVIARNTINSFGSLFLVARSLVLAKICPKVGKGF